MASMKSKKEREDHLGKYPIYEDNPVSQQASDALKLSSDTEWRIESGNDTADIATGEIESTILTTKTIKKKDGGSFIKLFHSEVKRCFSLKSTGLSVLVYLMQSSKMNKNQVVFDPAKCKEVCGYSSYASVYEGLYDLMDKEIIFRSPIKNLYHFDFRVFFNGDRLVIINEFRKDNSIEPVTDDVSSTKKVKPKKIKPNLSKNRYNPRLGDEPPELFLEPELLNENHN